MLNFRKLKRDFSPAILSEGKEYFEKMMVLSAKIVNLTVESVRLSCQVLGNFDNSYECEVEIDRNGSTIVDSDCDCTYKYDCQHLAAVVFYLEKSLDNLLVTFSKDTDIDTSEEIDAEEKETLKKTLREAQSKEVRRQGIKQRKELLHEYIAASEILGLSPFFLPEEHLPQDNAELLVIFCQQPEQSFDPNGSPEIQLALRLPYRSKPLHISNIKLFLDAIRYNEMQHIGNRRFNFSLDSFDTASKATLKMIMDHARCPESKDETSSRVAKIDAETFGTILAQVFENSAAAPGAQNGQKALTMCGLFCGSLEEPLRFSNATALLRVELEYIEAPAPKILLNPMIVVEDKIISILEEARLYEGAKPGMIYNKTYYRFEDHIKRRHLRNLSQLREITIPEPLFGTFVENSLPELMRFAEVANQEIIEQFVTLPFAGDLKADCKISYFSGEMEASLDFVYDQIRVPAATHRLKIEDISPFVTPQGVLARNLTEERKIIQNLFQDFIYDPKQGLFTVKSEKKIVEFMTEIIPLNQDRIQFHYPENLQEQFIYDESVFKLKLSDSERIDVYEVDLKVEGPLNGVTMDLLWECLASKKNFIEFNRAKGENRKAYQAKMDKILVLDLEKLAPILQIFDELGIKKLENRKEVRPLWSLASVLPSQFKKLPIEFSMSSKLRKVQKQIISQEPSKPKEIPSEVRASLRQYQIDGVAWLERLRSMHLNGILADDMGLGKTLQAITSLTLYHKENPNAVSIVICPTSLVYNWKEEFAKFNDQLKVIPIDGTPHQRKKLISSLKRYDVAVTSYSLLQKDIESYKKISFGYVILDEGQHIKNRSTRNAKSVKMLSCQHRLILTGTPIENSLEELWSLFDFLMPGLLSSFDRFVEKYMRNLSQGSNAHLENLRRKLTPFILRRMKKDVLAELPPVSEIVYHCHLSNVQKELYRSYAKTAREELAQLVEKQGFDKVQIHVLATLTRLKQICCHPAIFAKEKAEEGDSAKYEMLMELLQTLVEGKHKSVIFSQYTRMLQIMRKDLQNKGIRFEYLDGSTKNRLDIVKKFNQDANIPVFLVSLKAGGSGLNLTGADTVVFIDNWWNPAVDDQARDRVHRIGQKKSVSSYKLVTMGTIEEKIIELQHRKKGLFKKLINTDEEAIPKLTWAEVLELLQTYPD